MRTTLPSIPPRTSLQAVGAQLSQPLSPEAAELSNIDQFLAHGVAAWAAAHNCAGQHCFISYAWEPLGPSDGVGPRDAKRVALQSWLKRLKHHLELGGMGSVKLDITNMQETVSDYMATGVAEADVILIIGTPQLGTRAMDYYSGQTEATRLASREAMQSKSLAELDALLPTALDEHGFNNLQKELWHARQKIVKQTGRVFLLLREGEFDASALPTQYFNLNDFLVRDCRQETSYMASLASPEAPVGLLPSLYDLPNCDPLIQSAYRAAWANYQTPGANAASRALLHIQATSVRCARDTFELSNQLSCYIPPDAQATRNIAGPRSPLAETIHRFLADTQQRVCLLQGHAGAGKTLFGLELEQRLWDAYQPYAPTRIAPLRIELKGFTEATATDCVRQTLKDDYDLDEIVISALKTSDTQFLFIFDGLDELAGGGLLPLYQANHLSNWGREPKALIGCRIEYLSDQPYVPLLGPGGPNNRAQLQEWYVAPFRESDIRVYLQQRHDSGALAGPLADYLAPLTTIPDLPALLDTPFLMKIYERACPELMNRTTALTRADLYAAFMSEWFSNEHQKLAERVGSQLRRGMKKAFSTFSERLAYAMYKAQVNEVHYCPQNQNAWAADSDSDSETNTTPRLPSNAGQWDAFFNNTDVDTIDARRGCPLRKFGTEINVRYSFIHQSFLEYFIAEKLWKVLTKGEDLNLPKAQATWGTRALTRVPKMPVVIAFLADKAKNDHTARLRLLRLTQASKEQTVDSPAAIAAANAITVFNQVASLSYYCHEHLEDTSALSGIVIPYADLQNAELSGLSFEGANLTGATLAGADLTHTNFTHTTLTSITLQQWPKIQVGAQVKAIAYRSDGQQLALACADNTIHLYNRAAESWSPAPILRGYTGCVFSMMTYRGDNQQVATVSEDHTVHLWYL